MKSAEYWQKRAEQVASMQHVKADKYSLKLQREYTRVKKSIQRDIEVFYTRFARNNEIDLSEAKKLLDSNQLLEFKMDLEEFTRLAKNNPDGRWTKRLNNVYYKTRISRLEALQLQIENAVQSLSKTRNEGMTALLSDTYTDSYYRTIFEIQKGTGLAVSFAKVDAKTVENIIKRPWLEENYSRRIWKDNAKLVNTLQTELSQAIIRGDSIDKLAKMMSQRMDVSYRSAVRLVQTEASHIQEEATFNGYRASGVVKMFQFIATLDERTCPVCGPLDGKIFKLSEREVGVNVNPLHPRCRCTTVAYFDDNDIGDRIAKNSDGQTIYIPADMNYKQWYEKYVA